MREYGQVQCAFWQSNDASGWSDTGRLLAIYLLTSPHSNGLGCYRLPDGYLAADLGWSSETISKGFDELFRNGFAYRFEGVVFLPNFLRWNPIANANVAKARQFEFEGLPKGEAKSRVAGALLNFGRHLSNGFETVCQTLSDDRQERYGKQNPTQPNPEPTQPKDSGSPGGDPAPNPEKPICLTNAKAERLSHVTASAIEAFNAILGKPHGQLAAVHLVNEVRENQVKRCLLVARDICERQYKSATITLEFWQDYFGECAKDPFKNGTGPYSGSHANWRPDFEYLTRKEVMTTVFDRAMSEVAA